MKSSQPTPPQLRRIQFTKSQFMQLPEPLRELLLRLGWVMNDLLLMQRFWLAIMNHEVESDAAKDASGSHAISVTLHLCGKVFEAGIALDKWLLQQPLGRDLLPQLNSEAQEAIHTLKKLRSNTSALKRVRDQFAFHYYPDGPISPLLHEMRDDERLNLYLGAPDGNSLRAFAVQASLGELYRLMSPELDKNAPQDSSIEPSQPKSLMTVVTTLIGLVATVTAAIERYALGLMFGTEVPSDELEIPESDYRAGVDIVFPPLCARPISRAPGEKA